MLDGINTDTLNDRGSNQYTIEVEDNLIKEVHDPDHYTVGGYEAIDVMRAKLTRQEFIGALKFNILKYTMRANYKGHHDQDMRKAAWYATKLVEVLDEQPETNQD